MPEHLLAERNFLKGFTGDKIHAVLCGVGLNLRKVLRKLARVALGGFNVSRVL
jgi:IS5 family transposase